MSCFIDELKSLNLGINNRYIEKSNLQINDAFNKLEKIDQTGMEYYVLDDGVYVTT